MIRHQITHPMNGLESSKIQCPCCWEIFETVVDCSIAEQTYIEDCYVCCRPLVLQVVIADGQLIEINVRAEDQ